MSADLLEAFGRSQDSENQKQKTREGDDNTILAFSVDLPIDDSQRNDHYSKNTTSDAEQIDLWRPGSSGNDILFDATLDVAEDDFGEFEDAQNDVSGHQHANNDLLDNTMASKNHHNMGKGGKLVDLISNEVPTINPNQKRVGLNATLNQDVNWESTATQKPWEVKKNAQDDHWGDFEQARTEGLVEKNIGNESNASQILTQARPTAVEADIEIWQPFEEEVDEQSTIDKGRAQLPSSYDFQNKRQESKLSNSQLNAVERPTNVPPPAILLEIMPIAFERISSDTSTKETSLQATSTRILMIHAVTARIIAGRSLRWKRDKLLAQSTKIGQAGKGGGMKLAALNKSEAVKEERDITEAISSWSRYSHKFNAVLSKTKSLHPRMTLNSSMHIKQSKDSAYLETPHPCPICGLKRDERVHGIDVDAEDSFGDFWISHWGHKDCHEFWNTYKDLLHQR